MKRAMRGRVAQVAAMAVAVVALVSMRAAAAPSALPWDVVEVRYASGVGPYFPAVVASVMGLSPGVRHGDAIRYTVGPRGKQDDYAAFFASLPYVRDVRPRPHRIPAEATPGAVIGVAPDGSAPATPADQDYVDGEILVKFRPGVTAAQIAALNGSHGVTIAAHLAGIDVYRLRLPAGVLVSDMVALYAASPLVVYAEPNFRVHASGAGAFALPGARPAAGAVRSATSSAPLLFVDPRQLAGDSVLVTFRPGVDGALADLVPLVFGLRTLEEADGANPARLGLARGANALTTARILKLCPLVMQAEPSYGR